MKFYKNIRNGEIIGVMNMRELISSPNENSIALGFKGYSRMTIYDVIHPNKMLGNGIVSFCITNSFLRENYIRVSKEIALSKYPIFKQYRHSDLVNESKERGIDSLNILMEQKF
jgi:hypothetical protein